MFLALLAVGSAPSWNKRQWLLRPSGNLATARLAHFGFDREVMLGCGGRGKFRRPWSGCWLASFGQAVENYYAQER